MSEPPPDYRHEHLAELGAREREMSLELARLRDEIARTVRVLAPPHMPSAAVNQVVEASGYSRFLIDQLRLSRHPWAR